MKKMPLCRINFGKFRSMFFLILNYEEVAGRSVESMKSARMLQESGTLFAPDSLFHFFSWHTQNMLYSKRYTEVSKGVET